MEQQILELSPDKESTATRFGDLYVRNLTELKAFLLSDMSSLHFGMAIDYHLTMEHINQRTNDSKPVLEHLQNLHKLKIPTRNHTVAITTLEYKEPKFFYKMKEHTVPVKNESSFNRITSWG